MAPAALADSSDISDADSARARAIVVTARTIATTAAHAQVQVDEAVVAVAVATGLGPRRTALGDREVRQIERYAQVIRRANISMG